MGRGAATEIEPAALAPGLRARGFQLPERLYHATLAGLRERILAEGLVNRGSRYEGRTASRPGHVYLADLDRARDYADEIEDDDDDAWICVVEGLRALPGLWVCDEDNLEHAVDNQVDANGDLVSRGWDHNAPAGVGRALTGELAYRFHGFSRPPRRDDPETLAQWAERHELERPDLVRYSLQRGSVAYRGAVPPAHLREL
jgi:hypothetical protein